MRSKSIQFLSQCHSTLTKTLVNKVTPLKNTNRHLFSICTRVMLSFKFRMTLACCMIIFNTKTRTSMMLKKFLVAI